MPRQTQPVELNNFVKGLITEASPLNFPPNASIDEDNFVLRRDGSRTRRLGIDLEAGSTDVVSSITMPTSGDIAYSTFKWSNVGGDSTKTFIVVQIGNELNVFDDGVTPLSDGYISSYVFTADVVNQRFSYGVVDGMLVVASGEPEISIFKYEDSSIVRYTKRLKIRDMFGVEDIAITNT